MFWLVACAAAAAHASPTAHLCPVQRVLAPPLIACILAPFPSTTGGYCNVDPPTCEPEAGCRILEPDPPFFTNATGVSFAFSSFTAPSECCFNVWPSCASSAPSSSSAVARPHAWRGLPPTHRLPSPPCLSRTVGGGPVRYRWAIGTTRWGRDVHDWVDWEGTNSTREVAVSLPTALQQHMQRPLPWLSGEDEGVCAQPPTRRRSAPPPPAAARRRPAAAPSRAAPLPSTGPSTRSPWPRGFATTSQCRR